MFQSDDVMFVVSGVLKYKVTEEVSQWKPSEELNTS